MNSIDIAIILIVIIIVAANVKKGFLSSLFNILSYAIAAILSKIFSAPVSQYIYDNYLSKRIISELYAIMPSGSISGEISAVMENIFDSLPPFIAAFVRQFSLRPDFAAQSSGCQFTVDTIEKTYLTPIVTNILSIIIIVLLFILFSVILKTVFYFINKKLANKKHKRIKRGNMFLGAILGVVKGVVFTGLVCAVLNIASPALNNVSFTEIISSSFFCEVIANILS